MNDRSDRELRWRAIVDIWSTHWGHPPRPTEIEQLRQELTRWPELHPVSAAMSAARLSLTDRPTVAWIMREARRRRRGRNDGTRPGCAECRGELWLDQAMRGEPPMLVPCPTCQPLQHQIWADGHYEADRPADSPEKQLTVDTHNARGARRR